MRRRGNVAPRRAPATVGFRSTLPLAELPTFSDSTRAVLPVTFRRESRPAVSFLASHNGGRTWQSAATITGRRALRLQTIFPWRSSTRRTGWRYPTEGGGSSASRTAGVCGRSQRRAFRSAPLASCFEGVSFASATTGWATIATCREEAGAHCPRREALYRTIDVGATWNPLNLQPAAVIGRH